MGLFCGDANVKITRVASFFQTIGSGAAQDPLKTSTIFLLTGNDGGAISFRGYFLRRLIGAKMGVKPTRISGVSHIDLTSNDDFFAPPPPCHFFICDTVSDKDFKHIDRIKDLLSSAKVPVYVILTAPNLTTKSKWVEYLAAHPSWALIPSYDFDLSEIKTYAALFYGPLWSQLSNEVQGAFLQLVDPQTLDQDLQKMALWQAGRPDNPLSVSDLKECLTPGTHKDLDHFLVQVLAGNAVPSARFLQNLEDDGLGDIALVRILLKELKIVMTCHQKQITAATLRGRSFQAGLRLPILKMPYYENLLKQWPVPRCVRGMAMLLSYERHVKTGAPGALSTFAHCLQSLAPGTC